MPPHYTPFLAASGLVPPTLHESEEPSAILDSIENLAFSFLNDLIKGHVNGNFGRINRTITNAEEQLYTGAIVLGSKITKHRFNARNVVSIARMFQVISFVQTLLLRGSRVCQRELFYVLIHSFQCQRQLNATVQDVSATLAVPRYALNIGASTRGVIAGSLRVALCGSPYQVDCQYVGSNGWPIPGDLRVTTSVIVASDARYILVIEKFGIFTRLVQDNIYDKLPCILICGKGYPSVATRAMTSLLANRLRVPVVGLADFNPHGLALLQCYRRGSIQSCIEGSRFVCNVRWLGLRASHIRKYSNIGMCGDDLTTRDATILDGLQENNRMIRNDERYVEEIEEMRQLGKYELQWLYGHCDGAAFLEKFVLEAILHGDYL